MTKKVGNPVVQEHGQALEEPLRTIVESLLEEAQFWLWRTQHGLYQWGQDAAENYRESVRNKAFPAKAAATDPTEAIAQLEPSTELHAKFHWGDATYQLHIWNAKSGFKATLSLESGVLLAEYGVESEG